MHCGKGCDIIETEDMNSRKNPERNTDTGCCSSAVGQVSDQSDCCNRQMTIKNANITNYDVVKKYMKSVLPDIGMAPNKSNRLWAEDHGYFFSLIELQPWYGAGCYLNVAMTFLWSVCQVEFCYFEPDLRIWIPETKVHGGLIMFDDPRRNYQIAKTLEVAINRIIDYRSFSYLGLMADALIARPERNYRDKADPKMFDHDATIVQALLGNTELAKRMLNCQIEQLSLGSESLKMRQEELACLDNGTFAEYINAKIALNRQAMYKKYPKIKKREFAF